MSDEALADQFWAALDIQQEWMTRPEVMYDEDELIWKMTAKEGYLFDDSFWEVFQSFPFKICHVSYSGAPWSLEGGPPEMVLRFAMADPLEVVLVEHSDDGARVDGPWLLCGERVIKGEPHPNGVVFQVAGPGCLAVLREDR